MGREKKVFNRDGTFQVRFRDLYSKSNKTQKELAGDLGVSRPTVVGWLDGKNIPDILSLAKIAQLFNVSADYLLGLSDMASPDVTLRAAAEYTGLTEAAVQRLHNGLDDFECDGVILSEEGKRWNLSIVSSLIRSKSFTRMVHDLGEVSREAYFESVLAILDERYSECDLPEEDPRHHYAKKADRDIVVENLIHVLEMGAPHMKESVRSRVCAMDDDELATDVVRARWSAEEENELHQFHAAKAFTGYIDEVVRGSRKRAEKRFTEKY